MTTQADLDNLKSEVLMMASGATLQKLEAAIKSRDALSLEGQERFLINVRNAFEQAEVADFLPPPVHNGDGSPRKADRNNPWSRAGWNVTAQAGVAKRLGVEKAAALAKSAGCVLGSTKPNPDFN